MATASSKAIDRAELPYRVNPLRKLDNVTNWYYLAREYLLLGTVIGLTIAFFQWRADSGLGWWWDVPVGFVAVLLIGAWQHRLSTLGHEASHYILFRNRLLNELVSDILCMFPLWSTTHLYRLQHLAHHQFPNDPERDPDQAQLELSGHRFDFPMSPGEFVWKGVIKQFLWLPSLIRYIRIRARFAATGGGTGPYGTKGPRSPLLVVVGLLYLAGLAVTLTALVVSGHTVLLAVAPPLVLAAVLSFYAFVPTRSYRSSLLRPTVSPRVTTILRVSYLSALWTGLAWLTVWTGRPWGLYYIVLWLVPLVTAFSFFMILRQLVQHGNADSGRFTNTRVFLVGRLIRWSVFPLGMDYHLPHHLFPLVPHYRLKELHELVLASEFHDEVTIVEGYFFHRRPPQHATVLEIMATPAGK